MKSFLIRAFSLAFIFFLSVEFYVLLEHFATRLFSLHHSQFIHVAAGLVSFVLLTTSIISLLKNCKTFNQNDHKINKIR
jgi:hypothetical protein